MKKTLLVVFLLSVAMATCAFAWYDSRDLERAHYMLDRGDYPGAHDLFCMISRNGNTGNVCREADYFTCFSSVKMGDLWQAIEEYSYFLSKYNNELNRYYTS